MYISVSHICQTVILTVIKSLWVVLEAIYQFNPMNFLLPDKLFMYLIDSACVIGPARMIPHDKGSLGQSIVYCSQRVIHIQRIGIAQEKGIDVPYRFGAGDFRSLNNYNLRTCLNSLGPSIRFVVVGFDVTVRTIFNMIRDSYDIQPTNRPFPYAVFRFQIPVGKNSMYMKITFQSLIAVHIRYIYVLSGIWLLCLRNFHHIQSLQLRRDLESKSQQKSDG